MIPIPIAVIASATSGGSTTATAIHDMVKPHSRSTVTKGASVGDSRPHPSARLDHAVTSGCSKEALTPNDTSRVTLHKPQGRRLFERTNAQAASIGTAVPARTTPQLHTGRLARHRPR
ncbi:hypothetical protein CCUG60885_03092 [Mycobacteroides salmoniphilum]|uniref:Uncharacterized protein n=1 Tax=Mycobacteroides salmoniphilum TaxID=404941 RepID=A0A4R8SDJ7_9MYCO|nr:hypothetical protein CCUG60885_03092 [Mycobacteroides salmoniphilum]TEA09272.1 hypothetical protein CCUG60883_00033 [Mycobacteroides salmoniphilum]